MWLQVDRSKFSSPSQLRAQTPLKIHCHCLKGGYKTDAFLLTLIMVAFCFHSRYSISLCNLKSPDFASGVFCHFMPNRYALEGEVKPWFALIRCFAFVLPGDADYKWLVRMLFTFHCVLCAAKPVSPARRDHLH